MRHDGLGLGFCQELTQGQFELRDACVNYVTGALANLGTRHESMN